LSTYKNGYLLGSLQNLMLVDTSGETLYHTYHQSPGSSLLADLFMISAFAFSFSQGHLFYPVPHSKSQHITPYPPPSVLKECKDAWYQSKYTYMSAKVQIASEKGGGVVKINKENGKTESQIILHDNNPFYFVDVLQTRLFYLAKKNILRCYSF
jgi:hypothetical protein